MPATLIRPPISRPTQLAVVEGSIEASGESAKTGLRKLVTALSTPGTWMKPANRARKARIPIATFIGGDCSAMWCSSPGKPTSVSSTSPVFGLVGSCAWTTWPVSIRCWASAQGSPRRTRKISRKV